MHLLASNGNQLFTFNYESVDLYLPSLSIKSKHHVDITLSFESSAISYHARMFIANEGIKFYEFIKNDLVTLENALTNKKWMRLCGIKNCIYSIGGFPIDEDVDEDDQDDDDDDEENNEVVSTDGCEKYDIITNKWMKIPDLNKERHSMVAAFSFNNLWVYAFKGCRSRHEKKPLKG